MNDDRTPRWVPFAVLGLMLAVGGAIPLWQQNLPYYAWSAGPVGDAIDAVEVESAVTVYPPQGELFYLTVAAQEINAIELLVAALDPTVDLVRKELIRRVDETPEDLRRRSLVQMDEAKETAIALALARLGDESLILSDGIELVEVTRDDLGDRLQVGDIIETIEGAEVRLSGDVRKAVEGRSPGDVVTLGIRRGNARLIVRIPLLESPQESGRVLLGVLARTANPRFPVDIESANLGGPSAGMMYTLAIIDKLSDGDLTNGHLVAGTGTVDPEGNIGPIGGVRQKVVAAQAAGATLMLVPEANYPDALTAPRDKMRLVSVRTLDEALEVLAALAPIG